MLEGFMKSSSSSFASLQKSFSENGVAENKSDPIIFGCQMLISDIIA